MPQSQRGGNLSLILIFWNGLEPPNAWTVTMGYAPRWLFQRGNDDQQWYGLGYPIFRQIHFDSNNPLAICSPSTPAECELFDPEIQPFTPDAFWIEDGVFVFVGWPSGLFDEWVMASSNTHFFWLNRVPFNPCLVNFPFWWWIRQNAAILEHLFRESRHFVVTTGKSFSKVG